jgi:hypothetical protein
VRHPGFGSGAFGGNTGGGLFGANNNTNTSGGLFGANNNANTGGGFGGTSTIVHRVIQLRLCGPFSFLTILIVASLLYLAAVSLVSATLRVLYILDTCTCRAR